LDSWYAANGFDFLLNTQVTSIDLDNSKLTTSNGTNLHYDRLVFATGLAPRRANTVGTKEPESYIGKTIFYVRLESDSAALIEKCEKFGPGKAKVVIMGSGFLGLEAACGLRGWDFDVTVVSPTERTYPDLFTKDLSDQYERALEARGVKFIWKESISEFLENGNCVLKSGRVLDSDFAVVAVGAVPVVELIEHQVEMDEKTKGIRLDPTLRTSHKSKKVFAIGDVASFQLPTYTSEKRYSRVEHVHCAREMAKHLAASLSGSERPFVYRPYFYSRVFEWSDKPLIWDHYGTEETADTKEKWHFTLDREKERYGAYWVSDLGTVTGGLLFNGTDEEKKEMKAAIGMRVDLEEIKGRWQEQGKL
jgi:3-phenylpropionate/trans-cinnamate dioxygenase ferredoxin reductase subunit